MVNKIQEWIPKGMKPVCTDCGSDNLIFEGNLQWDETTEDWELVTEPDYWVCRNCDDADQRLDTPDFKPISEGK